MTTTRKQYSPQFKARVAMEAIRGKKTLRGRDDGPELQDAFGLAVGRGTGQ
jgi:hypothetical protein